jgi:phytoene synthase
MKLSVPESYDWCRRLARDRAKNFYYSFLLLSKEQRNAICAVYAFMRECDDLSDEPGANRNALDLWRTELDRAMDGSFGEHPCWPALRDAVARYQIPQSYLHEMIEGVSLDLEPRRIQTFDELYRYCYLVASVVGLTVIHIFGFESPEALILAEKCGIAFQLTNIIRDVREDRLNNRVYIPREDLDRFGVDPDRFEHDERFVELMRFEGDRAFRYYDESMPLLGLVDRKSRPSLWALIEIYHRLLERIQDSGYNVLDRRIRLSSIEKIGILLRAMAGAGWTADQSRRRR